MLKINIFIYFLIFLSINIYCKNKSHVDILFLDATTIEIKNQHLQYIIKDKNKINFFMVLLF